MLESLPTQADGTTAGHAESCPDEWMEQLRHWLAPLEEGLAKDLLAYVRTGQPANMLATLSSQPEAAKQLALVECWGRARDLAATLYAHFDQVPPAMALRWARALEASARGAKLQLFLPIEPGSHWTEALLCHSTGQCLRTDPYERPKAQGLTAACLDAMCIEAGLPPEAWLRAGFPSPGGQDADPPLSKHRRYKRALMLTDVVGYPDALVRHGWVLEALLHPAELSDALHVFEMIDPAPQAALDLWGAALAAFCTSSSKQVRAAAEALLPRCGRPLIDAFRDLARKRRGETRLHALRKLAQLARLHKDEALMQDLKQEVAADASPASQALLAEWTSDTPANEASELSYPRPDIDWRACSHAVPPALLAQLVADVRAVVDETNEALRASHERGLQMGHTSELRQLAPFSDESVEALQRMLATDGPVPAPLPLPLLWRRLGGWHVLDEPLLKLARSGELTPVALVKVLAAFGCIEPEGPLSSLFVQCVNALHRSTGRPSLLELSELLEAHGTPAKEVLRSCTHVSPHGEGLALDWDVDAVWPYMAYHASLLLALLRDADAFGWQCSYLYGPQSVRARLFKAIATLPALPPILTEPLLGLALGSAKVEGALAQSVLDRLPGKEPRILSALQSGKAELRAAAARWLGRLGHAAALPALEDAVRKEKSEGTKDALLDALQMLGQPLERYLEREALLKEARKQLVKDLPKELAWFPFDRLPVVHWTDSQAPVDPDLLRWLLVQSCKQKSPEPHAMLRKLCSVMAPHERQALGQFVLERWMAHDVRGAPPEAAQARAQHITQRVFQLRQTLSHGQPLTDYEEALLKQYEGLTEDQIMARVMSSHMSQPIASAIDSKGLLAVAAACCGAPAVGPVHRYLRTWHSTRVAQGRALIAMLDWIEHPSATQLMLSIGHRFRTKSIQEEAHRRAQALAERMGWSLDELADRTIPSAGFDEHGTLELSYGPRSFTAQLRPQLKIELSSPEGKTLATLPSPRQSDDPVQAKEAKKTLAAAKKELQSILDLQSERLYEAMCLGRDWRAADWMDCLLKHPVMRQLVQRLVWIETVEEGEQRVVRHSFRPLDDGTLTDAQDEPVELLAGSRVALAHDLLLSPAQAAAWPQHLADYAVTPLFQQFGKGRYVLPPGAPQASVVSDFVGHRVGAYALRHRATQLGYVRNSSPGSDWYDAYVRRFPTLGMAARLQFTGCSVPEEDRVVALKHLSFLWIGPEGASQRGLVPLDKVPAVLLSECVHDLRLIASEGSGFDPEWQKTMAHGQGH